MTGEARVFKLPPPPINPIDLIKESVDTVASHPSLKIPFLNLVAASGGEEYSLPHSY